LFCWSDVRNAVIRQKAGHRDDSPADLLLALDGRESRGWFASALITSALPRLAARGFLDDERDALPKRDDGIEAVVGAR